MDFLYLDLSTCERCIETDETLKKALDVLSGVFDTLGFRVKVNSVNITSKELAEEYRFISSPTIRVNGADICSEIKESACKDCGCLCGDSVDCRVFVYEGKEYERPPAAMIVDGILKAIYGQKPCENTVYTLPKNLGSFFTGNNREPEMYVCYCNKVTEQDIFSAMKEVGARTIEEVIKITGAMKNSNCAVNNPKGVCCYPDIADVFNKLRSDFPMKSMTIYEPAMCCETGICGVGVDSELLRISTVFNNLKKHGVSAVRFNLNNFPQEFINNAEINVLINSEGVDALPATVVDGRIVKTKAYPNNEEIAAWLEIPADYLGEKKTETEPAPIKKEGGCNCEKGCC